MTPDQRLRQVFRDVFDVEPDTLNDNTSPHTIEGWDSVGHLNLILALEGEFMIQFDAEEIPELVSYHAILKRVGAAEHLLE